MAEEEELDSIATNFKSDLKSPNLVKMMAEFNNNNSMNSSSCIVANKYKGIC